MSRFLARLGAGPKKKDTQSPGDSPSAPAASSIPTSSNSSSTSPATAPRIGRRASKQLLNFVIASPGRGADRPGATRNGSSNTASSTSAPKIELDFDGEASRSSNSAAPLHSTGVGLQSPVARINPASFAESREGNVHQQSKAISEGELESLRKTRFTWAQVEKAWAIAGQELKIIGLKTPDLFRTVHENDDINAPTTQPIEEIDRLLASFAISTSPSPADVLPSFPSLSDYYPPVSFLPQTPEWYETDFKTHVSWVKDPRVLVGFLKTVMLQLNCSSSDRGTILPEWYTRFRTLERTSAYPSDGFSRLLAPLITLDQHQALCTMFDIWAVVTANAAYNGCRAREVLCGYLGWWVMGSRIDCSRGREDALRDGEEESWGMVYQAWREAGDATYHLFMAWIRDQEHTGKLPLLVLDHVMNYQQKVESPADGEQDAVIILKCSLSYQPPSSASTRYSPTPEDLIHGLLVALENDGDHRTATPPTLGKWRRLGTSEDRASHDPQDQVELIDVIRAIRDAQFPRIQTKSERLASNALPQTPTTTTDDSFYRPFRTPSSSSFMQEADTPNGMASPGIDAPALGFSATSPRSPYTATSKATTPGTNVSNAGDRGADSADWTDFAQTGFGETVSLPKPFGLGEAFKELKIRDGEAEQQSSIYARETRELGIGRPRNGPRPSQTVHTGTYSLDSYGTTTINSAFVGFEEEARYADREVELWPPFGVLSLDTQVVQRFDLSARYLLVSVKLVNPQPPKQDLPPIPIEKDRSPVAFPLHTPPLSETTRLGQPSIAHDSEKRNRRRSFFRSFSGGSSKNRKTSSPITISSPMELLLPAVMEKREPLPQLHIASQSEAPQTPPTIHAPQPMVLSPNQSPNLHSRSSSLYRKPVPVLGETELRELERSGARTETDDSSRMSVVKRTEFSDVSVVDLTEAAGTDQHTPADADLDEYEEVIRAESPATTLSANETSDLAKSPHRRRRSGAPSPASLSYVNGDLMTEPVPTEDLGSASDHSPIPVESLEQPAVDAFDCGEPLNDAISETTILQPASQIAANGQTFAEADQRLQHRQSSDSLQAPVTLGAAM